VEKRRNPINMSNLSPGLGDGYAALCAAVDAVVFVKCAPVPTRV
jgi:hypothetical protein